MILSRKVALVAFALVVLVASGCGGNSKKIVGKWKVIAIGDKADDGKNEGIDFVLEFKSDGTGAVRLEATDPKKQENAKDGGELFSFKWSVKGDKIELTSAKEKGEGIFGKKEKATGTIKFEGDTLTLTPDEAGEKAIKLTKKK